MILSKAKYEECPTCHASGKMISEETYGCDYCSTYIDSKNTDYLRAVIFHTKKSSVHKQFCSWLCCLKFVKTVDTDYFVSLPYLSYDNKTKGTRAEDFWKACEALKKRKRNR